MKNIFIPKILLLLVLAASYFSSNAQCDDPCPPGAIQWMRIPLCSLKFDVNCAPPFDTETADYVFMDIAYRIRDCNGDISIIIEDHIYVNNEAYWMLPPTSTTTITPCSRPVPCPPTTPCPILTSTAYPVVCNYSPASVPNIEKALRDAVGILVNELGNPSQGMYQVYFKGSCRSLVSLQFPDGAFFPGTADDSGHIDTVFLTSESIVYQSIPCNDGCCKAFYEWRTVTQSNGETISKLVLVRVEGDENSCSTQPIPDYNNYPNKIEATIIDPITGGYIQVTGTPVGQEPCKPICSFLDIPPPSLLATFNTDVAKVKTSLVFTANPTLVNDFVRFTSNQPIKKVMVYDLKGRNVSNDTKFDNNELNTASLKAGVYLIQIYFSETDVKTIKVLKQE